MLLEKMAATIDNLHKKLQSFTIRSSPPITDAFSIASVVEQERECQHFHYLTQLDKQPLRRKYAVVNDLFFLSV